jgi:hypothetical protein
VLLRCWGCWGRQGHVHEAVCVCFLVLLLVLVVLVLVVRDVVVSVRVGVCMGGGAWGQLSASTTTTMLGLDGQHAACYGVDLLIEALASFHLVPIRQGRSRDRGLAGVSLPPCVAAVQPPQKLPSSAHLPCHQLGVQLMS